MRYVITTILALLLAAASVVFVKAVKAEMAVVHAEGQCIARYIEQGVERKDIKVTRGSCEVIIYGEATLRD
ncbi:hypothetical protein pVco7_gp050 [Vibrio phage pVco-7]|uniref:Uncharacterized protein n=1 Tax=Vibrio phage pVco-5 TaxID=1965485 RepID=A0A1W6JUT6_9CAUD|nr:hypothetical protein KNT61_gp051 [Vibrio phage pVco-5]ARM71039.1 hypothetical protein pVco5_051 [Vibrio phage pVco-5]